MVASSQDCASDPPRRTEVALPGSAARSGTVAVSRHAFPHGFTAATRECSPEVGTGLGVNAS